MSNTTTTRKNANTIIYPPQQLLEHNYDIQPLTQGISPPIPPLSQNEIQQRLKEIHNNVKRIRKQTENIKGGRKRTTDTNITNINELINQNEDTDGNIIPYTSLSHVFFIGM